MGQALIRNLDDAVLNDYRHEAKRNGRSLEAELRDTLTKARPKPRLSRDDLTRLTLDLWAKIPAGAAAIDSTAYIRAMRDSR